jgi:hypothetical protein
LKDGRIIDVSIVGANTRTDISSVADIFYTIPARKKFLKTRDFAHQSHYNIFENFSGSARQKTRNVIFNDNCRQREHCLHVLMLLIKQQRKFLS